MNRKGEGLILQAIVFLVLWLIASLVWSMWLDGISVPLAGCMTSLAVLGVFNVVINLGRK